VQYYIKIVNKSWNILDPPFNFVTYIAGYVLVVVVVSMAAVVVVEGRGGGGDYLNVRKSDPEMKTELKEKSRVNRDLREFIQMTQKSLDQKHSLVLKGNHNQ
jgi:hypothetical protein